MRTLLIAAACFCVPAASAYAHDATAKPRPPDPRVKSERTKRMYACNVRPARWSERELRCTIRIRFRTAGQSANAQRIAACESVWNPRAVSRTDDHGLFQINRRWNVEGWRLGANIYDPVWNTRIAYWFWQTRGWGDWACARMVGVR